MLRTCCYICCRGYTYIFYFFKLHNDVLFDEIIRSCCALVVSVWQRGKRSVHNENVWLDHALPSLCTLWVCVIPGLCTAWWCNEIPHGIFFYDLSIQLGKLVEPTNYFQETSWSTFAVCHTSEDVWVGCLKCAVRQRLPYRIIILVPCTRIFARYLIPESIRYLCKTARPLSQHQAHFRSCCRSHLKMFESHLHWSAMNISTCMFSYSITILSPLCILPRSLCFISSIERRIVHTRSLHDRVRYGLTITVAYHWYRHQAVSVALLNGLDFAVSTQAPCTFVFFTLRGRANGRRITLFKSLLLRQCARWTMQRKGINKLSHSTMTRMVLLNTIMSTAVSYKSGSSCSHDDFSCCCSTCLRGRLFVELYFLRVELVLKSMRIVWSSELCACPFAFVW